MDLEMWCKKTVKSHNYYMEFVLNGFDNLEMIGNIKDINILKEIGITKIGHRLEIYKAIQTLREEKLKENALFASYIGTQSNMDNGTSTNVAATNDEYITNINRDCMEYDRSMDNAHFVGTQNESNVMGANQSMLTMQNENEYKNVNANSMEETLRNIQKITNDDINRMPLYIQDILSTAKGNGDIHSNLNANDITEDITMNIECENNENNKYLINDTQRMEHDALQNGEYDTNRNTENITGNTSMDVSSGFGGFVGQQIGAMGGNQNVNECYNMNTNINTMDETMRSIQKLSNDDINAMPMDIQYLLHSAKQIIEGNDFIEMNHDQNVDIGLNDINHSTFNGNMVTSQLLVNGASQIFDGNTNLAVSASNDDIFNDINNETAQELITNDSISNICSIIDPMRQSQIVCIYIVIQRNGDHKYIKWRSQNYSIVKILHKVKSIFMAMKFNSNEYAELVAENFDNNYTLRHIIKEVDAKNVTLLKLYIDRMTKNQQSVLNHFVQRLINDIMVKLSRSNISNHSINNRIKSLFCTFFEFQLFYPALIVEPGDNEYYKRYLLISKDVINETNNLLTHIIDCTINVGMELLSKQTEASINFEDNEQKENIDEINKKIQLLSDEIKFGDDTFEDAIDLNIDKVNIRQKYIGRNKKKDDKQQHTAYLYGSYTLTQQIMNNVRRNNINTDFTEFDYKRINVANSNNGVSIKIECINCLIKYPIKSLNINDVTHDIYKDKRMICGICSGHHQFNIVQFLEPDDVETDIIKNDRLYDTLKYFAKKINKSVCNELSGILSQSDIIDIVVQNVFAVAVLRDLLHNFYAYTSQKSISFIMGLIFENMKDGVIDLIENKMESSLLTLLKSNRNNNNNNNNNNVHNDNSPYLHTLEYALNGIMSDLAMINNGVSPINFTRIDLECFSDRENNSNLLELIKYWINDNDIDILTDKLYDFIIFNNAENVSIHEIAPIVTIFGADYELRAITTSEASVFIYFSSTKDWFKLNKHHISREEITNNDNILFFVFATSKFGNKSLSISNNANNKYSTFNKTKKADNGIRRGFFNGDHYTKHHQNNKRQRQ